MTARSPIIYWLLLAATLAVSAVTVSGICAFKASSKVPGAASSALYGAWMLGILTIASIWAVFSPRRRWWTNLVWLFAAVAVVALVVAWAADFGRSDIMAYCGSYVTALTLLLWAVKNSWLWPDRAQHLTHRWQFSVGHMLVLMTIVALLITSVRDSELVRNEQSRELLLVGVVTNVLLALGLVLIWAQPWHPVVRLAAMLALGGLVGWCAERATSPASTYAVPSSLIEVLFVFAWLEFGGIIPRDEPADSAPPPPPRAPNQTT
jgi:hypothetical protein